MDSRLEAVDVVEPELSECLYFKKICGFRKFIAEFGQPNMDGALVIVAKLNPDCAHFWLYVSQSCTHDDRDDHVLPGEFFCSKRFNHARHQIY